MNGMGNTGILISVRPQWVRKIISGEKTMEVRKVKPGLPAPFQVYCYCTKTGDDLWLTGVKDKYESVQMNGKVCMEFTCDRVDTIRIVRGMGMVFERDMEYIPFGNTNETCLTKPELYQYLNGNVGYAWHIADLKVYVNPLDIDTFTFEGSADPVRKAPQGMVYVDNPHRRCVNCDHREGNKCMKLTAYLHYETIFLNSCEAWTLSRKGCYATCTDEFPELRK